MTNLNQLDLEGEDSIVGFWGGHRKVEYMMAPFGPDDFWFCDLLDRPCGGNQE